MKTLEVIIVLSLLCTSANGQTEPFDRLNFLIGEWSGSGSGFGNDKSKIESRFTLTMDSKYIEVINDSKFDPTPNNPKGEHHIDKGFISYDGSRKLIVFRQFNIEGYINQYILIDSLSSDDELVFVTETIENFVPGGKAKWTIKKISDDRIEPVFDVYFPNRGYTCMGTHILARKD